MSKQSSDHKSSGSQNMGQRLNILEQNLSRVCLQQDAMMPMLQQVEHIHKLESQIKSLLKRQDEIESTLTNKTQEKSRDTSANTSFSDIRTISRTQPKNHLDKQIQELNTKFNQLDTNIQEIEKMCVQHNASEDLNRLEQLIKDELVQLKQDAQAEYKNIYKDINGLKCDLEYIVNNQKKKQITQKMASMNVQVEDKYFIINLLEQERFVEDLDHYENENTFRMLFELDYFESQKEQNENSQSQQSQRESLYLEEKLIAIKYQLAASKKKYLLEIRKIEDKFAILNDLIQSNPKYLTHSQKIQQLDQKMKKIISRLHQNIESLYHKINSIDRK